MESVVLSREIMLCLERVNISFRDSEVVEVNEGTAGDSGDEKRKFAKSTAARHNYVTMSQSQITLSLGKLALHEKKKVDF